MRMIGTLVIGAPRQPGKALLFEEDANVGRAEGVALVLEQALNVINGEVLLAGLDNPVANRVGFGGLVGAFGWGQEERPRGVLAEVVNQNAETAFRIAKAPGRLLGGELVDKEGAQGLVLAVSGVGGPQEGLRRVG